MLLAAGGKVGALGLVGPASVLRAQKPRRSYVTASSGDGNRAASRKGKQFEKKNRRRGRPAWLRTPYDTPLRDGNRDRLIGLLTERAAKTLMVYLMETNPTVYQWLVNFYKENPIPKNGSWDDVSGESFLRKLLSMPVEEARFHVGRDALFDNSSSCGVDPRNLAQRIMDIRTQLSEEFIQELQSIAEENSLLLREALSGSLAGLVDHPADSSGEVGSWGARGNPGLETPKASSSATAATSPATCQPTSSSSSKASTPVSKSGSSTPAKPTLAGAKGAASSPTPGTESSGEALPQDKAALVAALSAAFSKDISPGFVGGSSHPELAAAPANEEKPAAAESVAGELVAAAELEPSPPAAEAAEEVPASSSSVPSFVDSLSRVTLPAGLDLASPPATAAPAAMLEAAAAEETPAVALPVVAAALPKGWGPQADAVVEAVPVVLPVGWGPRVLPPLPATAAAAALAANNIVSSGGLKRAGCEGAKAGAPVTTAAADCA